MAATLKTTVIQEPSSGTVNMTLGSTGGVTFGSSITSNTITSAASTALNIQSAGTTAMTIDTSQNVGIGVTPSAWNSAYPSLQIKNAAVTGIAGTPYIALAANNYTSSSSDDTSSVYISTGVAGKFKYDGGAFIWQNAASGSAGSTITWTKQMTLDSSGNLLVGTTTSTARLTVQGGSSAEGTALFNLSSSLSYNFTWYVAAGTGANAAATAQIVPKNSSTSRSINAAGTINASGADYAEYMTKSGDFTVAKGDVVGINSQGKLTNVFNDAISFVVKSTDPSYVGGDVWGTEEIIGYKRPTNNSTEDEKAAFESALEKARQLVDRIAFAGQVPVNVTGATAGQYIIPVNDNGAIKGQAVSNPTFEQYQISVGKVVAIESDGRARIIVKVA